MGGREKAKRRNKAKRSRAEQKRKRRMGISEERIRKHPADREGKAKIAKKQERERFTFYIRFNETKNNKNTDVVVGEITSTSLYIYILSFKVEKIINAFKTLRFFL